MKRNLIIVINLLLFLSSNIHAEEITNDITIKYKWYQETISDELYYPKGESLENYLENPQKISYGSFSEWSNNYCDYSRDIFDIETKNIFIYDEIAKTKYLRLAPNTYRGETCYDCLHKFNVYYHDKLIPYEKEVLENNTLILTLPEEYDSDKLLFEVETDYIIDLTLSADKEFTKETLFYFILKDSIVDSSSAEVINNASYNRKTSDTFELTPYIKNAKITKECRARTINTYRYKISKNYYDNNYYEYLEGYLPDYDDYIIEYNKDFPREITEVIKEIPIYEKEYIYIETDNNSKELDYIYEQAQNNKRDILEQNQDNNESNNIDHTIENHIDGNQDKINSPNKSTYKEKILNTVITAYKNGYLNKIIFTVYCILILLISIIIFILKKKKMSIKNNS